MKSHCQVISKEYHVKYFKSFLSKVPTVYTSLDQSRLLIIYFACAALDILHEPIPDKQRIADWIYSNQLSAQENGEFAAGFIGSNFCGEQSTEYHYAHITMTYCAILTLIMIGDDLTRLDKPAIIKSIKFLQAEDGSFQAVGFGTERDMRFVYSACAVSFLLQDWSGIDVDLAAKFIKRSMRFDGGMGILPDQESHCGAIYTALSSLVLLGRMDIIEDEDRTALLKFLVQRQVNGFNGRVNKVPDSCYTFWAGGSLQALGYQELIHYQSTKDFLMQCQFSRGGFSKLPASFPDILHSYCSVAGLSLLGEDNFDAIEAVIGLTCRSFAEWRNRSQECLDGSGKPFHGVVQQAL